MALALQRSAAPRCRAAAPCRPAVRRHRGVAVAAKPTAQLDAKGAPPGGEVAVLLAPEPLLEAPAAPQRGGLSPGLIGAGLAAALALGFVANKLRQRSAAMGYDYLTGRNDPFEKDVMRNVNTVQMEELSPDIIAAARARRSRERANQRLDLEEVELPENHPWATRKPMSKEQDAAIQERLSVRPRAGQRGGPPAGTGGDARPRVPQRSRE
ncbi:hypothetical protein HT031_000522 [Scenedesmus sp. PABB004]|nr:hypothetical protein HT031_000522 [Scenedesmus sp. PABB004]